MRKISEDYLTFIKKHLGVDMTRTEIAAYLECPYDDIENAIGILRRYGHHFPSVNLEPIAFYSPRKEGDPRVAQNVVKATNPIYQSIT